MYKGSSNNEALSQDEINQLLEGINMDKEKSIVLTVYGHNREIDKIAVSLFDSNAMAYCETINNLKLEGKSWVFAKIISENVPYILNQLIPPQYDTISGLDDNAIQKEIEYE